MLEGSRVNPIGEPRPDMLNSTLFVSRFTTETFPVMRSPTYIKSVLRSIKQRIGTKAAPVGLIIAIYQSVVV